MTRDDVSRLRATLPMMLLSWIVLAAAATSPAIIASAAFSSRGPDPGGALVIEALLSSGRLTLSSWLAFASPLLLLALASPLLSVAWLRGLGRRAPLRECLAHGARRYGAAILSSLALLPVLLVSLGLLGGLAAAVDAVVDTPDARARDLSTVVALVPGLLALAAWAAWHDLARAALATSSEGAVRATLGALRRVRAAAVARYAFFFALGLCLAVLGVMATAAVTSALAVVVGQLFVLARLAVRGLYLSGLVRADLR